MESSHLREVCQDAGGYCAAESSDMMYMQQT